MSIKQRSSFSRKQVVLGIALIVSTITAACGLAAFAAERPSLGKPLLAIGFVGLIIIPSIWSKVTATTSVEQRLHRQFQSELELPEDPADDEFFRRLN